MMRSWSRARWTITTARTTRSSPRPRPRSKAKKKYSPYAGRKFPTRVFFGDTHHHTANSGDAFMAGDRLTPEQAYRFARGEEVVSSTGVPAKLSRPLDFLVVSDHAEGLGVMAQVYEGNPAFTSDPTLQRWGKAMKAGGEEAAKTMRELISAQAQGTLPPPIKDPKVVGPIMKSVWQQYTATAEKFNEPGQVHRDDRLRVDLGAGRQQPAPQRHVPRRQGQGRPDPAVLGVAERRPGEALGLDGEVRREDRRQAAGDSAQRATCPTAACSSWSTSPASR